MGESSFSAQRRPLLIAVAVLLIGCPITAMADTPEAATTQPSTATTAPAPGTETQPATQPETLPAEASTTQPSVPAIVEPAEIRPRFELYVPSLRRLASEARRSHGGPLGEHLVTMLLEMGRLSSEGVDMDSAVALVEQMKAWPDTALDAVIHAADNEGRQRWAVRFDWPLHDLHARLKPLLALEAAATLLQGVTLTPRVEGGYAIALPGAPLAYLLPAGDTQSLLASHPEVEFPAAPFRDTEESEENGPTLLVCRLNVKGTEKDSGATFFSSLSAVTDVVYGGRVNDAGDWVEEVQVHWPPGIGTLAKTAVGKIKQTFFVPAEAYFGAAVDVMGSQAMLDGMAGFGPQMMVGESGQVTMMGEAGPGPIAANGSSELCLAVLPGTGFIPVPDLLFQVKINRAEKTIEDLRKATEKINQAHREREQRAPWHETTVKERPVFWSEGPATRGGMMVPAVMRPVLFITKEPDAKDREREFLVLGLTSTSPERLVRRWVELPRAKDRRFLPTEGKTNGQLWINWRQTYHWIQPYLNVALSAVSRDLLLPREKEMADEFTDALVTAQVKYAGLELAHRGPLPAGVLAVPILTGIAAATDESGGSDLARERSACRRLRVLYHHAKLFAKDLGRWPAELAELDGYVDFAGHPELLKLELSSKKQRGEFWKGVFGSPEKKEAETDEEDEDRPIGLKDEVFVVSWSRGSWSVGLAPGTLEHLEALYIDQDGNIHRVEKKPAQAQEQRP